MRLFAHGKRERCSIFVTKGYSEVLNDTAKGILSWNKRWAVLGVRQQYDLES